MTVYIEGGGDGRSLRARFREGWSRFLQSAGAGRVKIVRGGGREQTFHRFAAAVTAVGPRAAILLLVDSEGRWRRDVRSGSTSAPVMVGHVPTVRATIRRS